VVIPWAAPLNSGAKHGKINGPLSEMAFNLALKDCIENMNPLKTRAFTLIELLIVIAIILILIAIALPNFLEAQIRAKLTKSQGEMRSLATAIEAYQTQYKTYPVDGDDMVPFNPLNFDSFLRLSVLTSPIKFIEGLPTDSFHEEKTTFPGSDLLFPGQPPFTYAYNTFGAFATDGFQPANGGKPDNFGLISLGPNMAYDADFDGPELYAPTNGTRSKGDLLRLGGRRTRLSPP
jgi:prepilin-type N-terminal cleavage/methylation domain-containing protein